MKQACASVYTAMNKLKAIWELPELENQKHPFMNDRRARSFKVIERQDGDFIDPVNEIATLMTIVMKVITRRVYP